MECHYTFPIEHYFIPYVSVALGLAYGKRTPTVSVPNATKPLDLPVKDEDLDPVKAEAGAIAGAVFGVLVCIGFITFAALMYVRMKRARDLENSRKTKVHKVSKESAGIYRDTTLQFIPKIKDSCTLGSEYKSLQRDRNLYETDSEDEL